MSTAEKVGKSFFTMALTSILCPAALPVVLLMETAKHTANTFAGDEGYEAIDAVDKVTNAYDLTKKKK